VDLGRGVGSSGDGGATAIMAKARRSKGASAKKAVMPKTEEATDVRETWNRLERAAKFNRITVASLMDQAVTKFVRESGFKEEPPER
jgi:hypothetical protein